VLENAALAMPDGGDIHVTAEEEGGFVHLYIQDSGVGLTDQLKDRIFDPYFTRWKHGGEGFGLSLVYAIVQKHGGDVEITSQPDKGTLVQIRLPVTPPKGTGKQPRKGRIKDARILMIEEDEIIGPLLSDMLSHKGCQVIRASGIKDGMKILNKRECNLVILDIDPGSTELERMIQRIRNRNQTLPVAVIRNGERSLSNKNPIEGQADLLISRPLDLNRTVHLISDLLNAQ
jgi:CheY-like chemotaxis protein